ncbi:MAG TPA: TIM barrel protein [Flavisolibacter sp.]|jgi:hydroxypyruvate isomerase|nr:TIM barrel protein [Flavisolibacter sp.]
MKQSRRTILKTMLLSGSAAMAAPAISLASNIMPEEKTSGKGSINHSVCRWTYADFSLEELCTTVKELGFSAIDLVGPAEWPILKKHGVDSSMCNGAEISLTEGFNDKAHHATLIKKYTEHIGLVSKAGYKNLICFSGNRRGMDDETGLKNCAEGLKKLVPLAEKSGVILQMELLNSKVDHRDYMCDKSAWGIELCKQVGSPNFKLLYDIYHMQIDEGDVIRTINNGHQYFGHYHTAGVPGRHEIGDNQELYYPAIMKAITATGFKGYVAQEFIPTGTTKSSKIAALKEAIKICDV